MVTKGLLVRLEAKQGKDADMEEFLRSALGPVREEPGTTAWFAVRFGPSEYGIFDVFPDDDARSAHMSGVVADALRERAEELFGKAPEVMQIDVLASKLPGD